MKVTMMIHIKIHFYLFISFFLDQLILRKILSVFKKSNKKITFIIIFSMYNKQIGNLFKFA